jgi:hypothetical protein
MLFTLGTEGSDEVLLAIGDVSGLEFAETSLAARVRVVAEETGVDVGILVTVGHVRVLTARPCLHVRVIHRASITACIGKETVAVIRVLRETLVLEK